MFHWVNKKGGEREMMEVWAQFYLPHLHLFTELWLVMLIMQLGEYSCMHESLKSESCRTKHLGGASAHTNKQIIVK